MIIKCQALPQHLKQKRSALYILTGQDHYLLNEAALQIKKSFHSADERDERVIDINNAADWNLLLEEANSYSLFSEFVLLDIRYDKKSLDSAGKKTLQAYLENTNSRCLIILRAPLVANKQLQGIAEHKDVTVVQAYPLPGPALQTWIAQQLKSNNIQHEASVPALIHQYTQNNMLACAQLIEKLVLIGFEDTVLTTQLVSEHLTDQCDYPIYELADACLLKKANQAIHVLRLASQNRSEAVLVLWILMQEVRQLIQLKHLTQSMPIQAACSQLKIWAQRTRLYESALPRFSMPQLQSLLILAQELDEQIKSNSSHVIWHQMERLALGLCGSNNA